MQYDGVRDELLADGIGLKMISIGKPEVGASLCDHLGVEDCWNFLFADPENKLYNDLDLNKGMDVTFFNPATPFAIRDRLFKKDGMKRLNEVLGKWTGAFHIPPKREQAFNQGGTFVFQGDRTLFAHYDESTGAHADIQAVVKTAKSAFNPLSPAM